MGEAVESAPVLLFIRNQAQSIFRRIAFEQFSTPLTGYSSDNYIRNAPLEKRMCHREALSIFYGNTVPENWLKTILANSMDWAKHRRRKAAAKCHMLLDARTFLPRFAVVGSAKSHDAVKGRILCNQLRDGEIVIFDKAYVDFKHLFELMQRGILWVTRAKSNMAYKVVGRLGKKNGNIIRDVEIKLTGKKSKEAYPHSFRLIVADVLRNGKMVRMEFITDNFDFSSSTICDLYKGRWEIELFFKQLKQTLKLSDFLGYSENAVQWQIWMALLTYVILRFIAYMSKCKGTFARLFTTIRGVLWSRFSLYDLLKCCGTAPGRKRMCMQPQQLYLPLFKS